MYIIAFIILGLALFGWTREIYSRFNHTYYSAERLDTNAQIVSCDSEQVKYTKNNAKFKTTVMFSDNFIFVTHQTRREMEGLMHYSISVDERMKRAIINEAKAAHTKALLKHGYEAPPEEPIEKESNGVRNHWDRIDNM